MKKYICKHCGKEFEKPTELGGHITKEHSNKSKENGKKRTAQYKDKYNRSPKKCKQCGNIIPFEKRENSFCSSSCSASYNNKGKAKNGKEIKRKKCLNCDKEFKPLSSSKGLFCSGNCSHSFRRLKKIKDFLNEEVIFKESQVRAKTIRNYILEEQEHKCEVCKTNDVWNNKKLVFVLDHIDGNSENNTRNNLRLVCPNCDSQLDTYKSKNKGSGRYLRRERYKQGKSY